MPEIAGVRATTRDLLAIGGDFTRGWITERTVGLEPLAAELLERGAGLKDFAVALGREIAAQRGKDPISLSDRMAVNAALNSKDFGLSTARGMEEFLIQSLGVNSAHRDLCLPVFAPDFKLIEFPTLDAQIDFPLISEGGEIQHQIKPRHEGSVGTSVVRRGALLLIAMETILNDDRSVVERMLSAIAAKITRTEHKTVIDAMDGADTLGDGDPVFSTEAKSLVTGETFGREAIGKAMAALRHQPVVGEPAGHSARWLIVPPEHEQAAAEIVRDMTAGSEPPLNVLVSPYLDATRFYVLADWREAPAVAFLTLDDTRVGPRWRQATGTITAVDPRAQPLEVDGTWYRARSEHAALTVSRIGVVRVDAEE